MICPGCAREIGDDVKFCPYCGVEFIDGTEEVNVITPEPEAPMQTPPAQRPSVKRSAAPLIAVVCVVALAALIGLGVWGVRSGVFGAREYVTDAAGEKIAVGVGSAEMEVRDVDGTVRTIKTDKSLVAAADILTEYTRVMNTLKTDAPAFSRIRWQYLPADKQSLGGIGGLVLPIIERYVTGKDAADEQSFPMGNADELPLYENASGCLLTDASKIKNAYCEVLEDGSNKLVITLVDELDPIPLPAGAESSQSAVSAMFYPFSTQNMISSVASLALTNISFNYTDCTATLVYNPENAHVSELTMSMNIDVSAKSSLASIQARIIDNTQFDGFIYP